MKHRQTILTGTPVNSRISNIQYPISNIQKHSRIDIYFKID
ncbi:hypothetical protein P0082_05290 [Candidatus Haliotispira prima]|uniref:Uncharacterized protein n=1 Tax=Candidatus Haliotispira prima TaxID=3034016 RepID=A0ABY8MLK8_9SPIO|nr:hypothetical protein P0082_05290 [Candidatus Haliotispira prima]